MLLETFAECVTGSKRWLLNHDMESEVQSMYKLRRCKCAQWSHSVCAHGYFKKKKKKKCILMRSGLGHIVDHWLYDCWAKLQGWARAPTVNDNPKFNLDMRYSAAVSDSEACLMPEGGLISAGTRLVIYMCMCVYFCGLEYCNHHLLPYETGCSPWGWTARWPLFPSAPLWGCTMCLGCWLKAVIWRFFNSG